MNVTYQRELNEAYMILEGEEECEEYALRILQENQLKGIMPLGIREVDGQRDYWFAVSDGKSLDRILEKRSLEYEEICQIIRAISKILGQMEEYLLNPEHLILDPAFLYLGNRALPRGQGHAYHETDFTQIMACCHPAWSRDFYEQMRILMQYFINKMDHRDAHGVEAAYQMFHVTEKEYFRMEELLQIMDGARHSAHSQETADPQETGGNLSMDQQHRNGDGRRGGRTPKGKEPAGPSAKDHPLFRDNPRRKEGGGKDNRSGNPRSSGSGNSKRKAGSYPVMKKVPSLLGMVLQMAGILLLGLAAWTRYRMGWIDTTMITGAIICLALGSLLRRIPGKEADPADRKAPDHEEQPSYGDMTNRTGEHITDSYVNYSKDEYREGRNYSDGGTELLTGSFPGRSNPVLISENLSEQENISMGSMPFTLGSGEGVKGHLDWSTISREHAVVDCQNGQYALRDCCSTNGTFLNGRRLEPEQWYPLRFGDEIVLANRGFIFRSGR